MTYFVYNRLGESIQNPAIGELLQFLESVDSNDSDHQDVSLNDEHGWSLSYLLTGLLIFENVETGEGSWYLKRVSTEQALTHWTTLAQGPVQRLMQLEWQDGYGT